MFAENRLGRFNNLRIFLTYGFLCMLGLIFLFPIVFMIVSSFKPDLQLLRDTNSLLAFVPYGELSLNNYREAFIRVPVLRFIFNSIIVTAITVLFSLVVNSMAGFALSVLRWKGRSLVLTVIIATFIVPFETVAIPLLLVVSKLPMLDFMAYSEGGELLRWSWMNTYHVQIIPFIASAFSIFLFVQFFSALPRDLFEAARIDGASWWQIYRSVVVPLSGPVFATVAILNFLPMWNQYLWPIMVVQSEELRPIMVGVAYFFQLGDVAWGEIMAYLTIITLPVLAFFLSLQRAFIESIANSGVKG